MTNPITDTNPSPSTFVAKGMPPLDLSGRNTSFFEFWPSWLMYLPVIVQWAILAVRYRSLSLPLIANPAVPLSGMVGVAKTAVFDGAGAEARRWILPWLEHSVTATDAEVQSQAVLAGLVKIGLGLPIVAKPNIGCRGAGVKLLENNAELVDYLQQFPEGGVIQFQELAPWEAEAGVFYVRHPDQQQGEITSLTLKYTPYVVGDGNRSLGELVEQDPRAGELLHLYQERHKENWNTVLAVDAPYRLVFSASHCRGAVFRNASDLITAKLSQKLDTIFDDIPGFHYGRLDIKFKDIEALMVGEEFKIIEINGASSESINIWDRDATFLGAIRALLSQYSTLFKLGHMNRLKGHKPPGMLALIKAWRFEANLVNGYPQND